MAMSKRMHADAVPDRGAPPLSARRRRPERADPRRRDGLQGASRARWPAANSATSRRSPCRAGGDVNVQGEVQKPLDVLSNEMFVRMNEWGGHLAGMASEEMDAPRPIPAQYPRGKYLLVFDPLDGSSNIDVNVSVGSIFSILRAPGDARSRAGRGRLPAARRDAGGRGLCDLRPDDDAGAERGQRRQPASRSTRTWASSC